MRRRLMDYCKVAGFKEKSLETLLIRIHEFNKFLKSKRFSNIRSVKYAHISAFVADYKSPSVHVKKCRDIGCPPLPPDFKHSNRSQGYKDTIYLMFSGIDVS